MKNPDDDRKLPYSIEVRRNEDGSYFGRVRELPGCMTEADTPEELFQMLADAQSAWIDAALEDGPEIPEPAESPKETGN